MRSDAERWNERHARAEDVGALPPAALRGRSELLPPGGRALDVACGRGAVTRWLVARGFTVDAVDVSTVGLAAAVGPRVRPVEHDLTTGLPPSCTGPYEVVVCQRYREPSLYPQLRTALAPGGLLVVTVLSEIDDEPGRYRARPGELRAAFAGLDVLVDVEGDGEASLVARAAGGSAG